MSCQCNVSRAGSFKNTKAQHKTLQHKIVTDKSLIKIQKGRKTQNDDEARECVAQILCLSSESGNTLRVEC